MNIKSQERRSDEGFTLIELLVVIVILGILSAVVVFAVGGISDKGETAASNADKKTVETAEEAYYAQNSVYGKESALVGQFLASLSTKYDVCVRDSDSKAYKIVAQNGACDSGYSK